MKFDGRAESAATDSTVGDVGTDRQTTRHAARVAWADAAWAGAARAGHAWRTAGDGPWDAQLDIFVAEPEGESRKLRNGRRLGMRRARFALGWDRGRERRETGPRPVLQHGARVTGETGLGNAAGARRAGREMDLRDGRDGSDGRTRWVRVYR